MLRKRCANMVKTAQITDFIEINMRSNHPLDPAEAPLPAETTRQELPGLTGR
jgi:hypothetical protein